MEEAVTLAADGRRVQRVRGVLRMQESRPAVQSWRGLNNVRDPLRLELADLVTADNVDVTQTGSIVRCRGFAQKTSNYAICGAYSTKDLQRLYVIDAGELRAMNPDLTYTVLRTGLSSAKYYFTEVNGIVYYTNGTDFGMIEDGKSWAWGIESPGAPLIYEGSGILKAGTYSVCCSYLDARGIESGSGEVETISVGDDSSVVIQAPVRAGYATNVYITQRDGTVYYLLGQGENQIYNGQSLYEELRFWLLNPPRGHLPAVYQGSMYIAEAYPEADQTVIWKSLPLHYHHFDPGSEGLIVPGTVRMLHATQTHLLIGTERAIYAHDGDSLAQLANYGVVPGWHASEVDGVCFFWTLRGLCSAMPFQNLTQSTVSVDPGYSAGAMVIEEQGYRRYLVALNKGGSAYNRYPQLPIYGRMSATLAGHYVVVATGS